MVNLCACANFSPNGKWAARKRVVRCDVFSQCGFDSANFESGDGLPYFNFSILALIATTIVLTLIRTAPIAGLSITPALYRIPAASGRAMTL